MSKAAKKKYRKPSSPIAKDLVQNPLYRHKVVRDRTKYHRKKKHVRDED